MGCYVNPEGMTKEKWLEENKLRSQSTCPQVVPDDCMIVCLIDNGPFKAAGVGFSEREIEEFNDSKDNRKKVWYVVEIDKLMKVSNLSDYIV